MKKEDIPAGVVRKVAWRLHPATTSPNDAVAGTASGVATRAASRLAALGAVTNSPAGPAEDFPAVMPSGESSDAPLHDAATQAADAGDMEVAHVGPSRADDPPAIPLPAADEAARVAAVFHKTNPLKASVSELLAADARSHDVCVGRSSVPGGGRGVFAERRFAAGESVVPFFGLVVYDDLIDAAMSKDPAAHHTTYGAGTFFTTARDWGQRAVEVVTACRFWEGGGVAQPRPFS
ncbi:hypothetical protein I4F81_006450 [Pyropia yezoensis]|uniref:Uncharacterized protein n=1 Tax=Pyropia yezoensis TaxID=2788 RepID=A0ACC3C171_PYRYE|nr:hypothetical protein I4F81_006450 [Neopyropia yezoensis]